MVALRFFQIQHTNHEVGLTLIILFDSKNLDLSNALVQGKLAKVSKADVSNVSI